jgi:cyclopropane fatty-acyl-phospholipid synthase-like methyltransferase
MSVALRTSSDPSVALRTSSDPSVALESSSETPFALGHGEFAELFGTTVDELPEATRAAIDAHDFRMTPLSGSDLAEVAERVRAALGGPLPVSGPDRQPAWEAGWGDILARYAASRDLADLEPHYFRKPSRTMRVLGRYVRPHDPRFEASFVDVLQTWLAARWLANASAIYEFGCGPGHNVAAFARLLPGRPIVGLDWATPSQQLLRLVATSTGLPISGRRIDMFAPDPDLTLQRGSAVVTIGAMEQLGERHDAFLAFLLAQAPAICVHVEPLHELYDPSNSFDDAARRYAERRGYLRGYLPRLESLARAGQIELLAVRRHLGSEFHDGWGSLIWRPRQDNAAIAPMEQSR